MNLRYAPLALLLAAAALPAAAQDPVNTLSLGAAEELRATLTLPNFQTLLFIQSRNALDVRVLALQPTGQKAWAATLPKVAAVAVPPSATGATGPASEPLLLTSAGNTAYSVEAVAEATPALPLHTLVVQELDAQGQVRRKTFAVPAPPAGTTRTVLTAYAAEGVVYVVAHEASKADRTAQFLLDRCDLGSGQFTQTALALPAAPEVKHGEEFYRNWVFGGARGGQAYFYRAVKGADAKANAREASAEFDVVRVGTDGHELGHFRTALQKHLPTGMVVQGRTTFTHYGQAHVPELLALAPPAGKGAAAPTSPATDQYDATTGGEADFYLDEASGDCLFAGQYSTAVFSGKSAGGPSLGNFVQRYAPDGKFVASAFKPYAALPGFQPTELVAQPYFLSSSYRDSQTQSLVFENWTKDHVVVTGYDAKPTPRLLKYVAHPDRFAKAFAKSELVAWSGPSFLQPAALATAPTGSAQPQLLTATLLALPQPIYQQIGKLVEAQLTAAVQHGRKTADRYTVSRTGPATALVLEAPREAGGQVAVYEVK